VIFSKSIRRIFNPIFIADIQSAIGWNKFDEKKELRRISAIERFTVGNTNLIKGDFKFIDSESFIYQFLEIFRKEILFFRTNSNKPRIIDCGANIGVSVNYFKKIYPNSHISAFEPDPEIFKVLEKNTKSFAPEGLELHNSAVWNEKGSVSFKQNDSDGGKICQDGNTLVKTVRLSDFLNEKVDLLKIDIEGAEKVVLPSIEDQLSNVDKLFLELHVSPDDLKLLEDACSILRRNSFSYKIETVGDVSFRSFEEVDTFEMQLNVYAEKKNS
jgi:FkbM family methyltransferase